LIVRITQAAERDLREIGDYIAEDNVPAAITFIDRLTERFSTLESFPEIGRARNEIAAGLRSLTEGDYLLLYRIRQSEVIVVRVVHGKRDIHSLDLLEDTDKL
jgi:toxin ParE1/3/4